MFKDPLFWLAILGTGSFLTFFRDKHERVAEVSIALVSVGVLYGIVGVPLSALLILTAIIVWVGFGLREKWPAIVVVGPAIAAWIIGKFYLVWPNSHLGFLVFLGFSFLIVKIWTLVRDVGAGKFEPPNMLTVGAYLLFFPTYVSGPMHYFDEFCKALKMLRKLTGADLVDTIFRIMIGVTKTTVIAPMLMPASLIAVPQAESLTVIGLVSSSVVYSIIIFCDFSGYTDIAIGSARLMGVEVPENFKRPYLSTNIREFWQRWHITFSRVLTTHLFVPLSRLITRKWTDQRVVVMVIGYMATFIFCGFWHGSALNYLIWGAYHGIGLIVFDIYTSWSMRRRLKQKTNKEPCLFNSVVAGFATFMFVSIGWIPFALPTKDLFATLSLVFGL